MLDRAIYHFKIALKLQPASAGTHNNLGFAFLMAGMFSQAYECYARVLEIDPDHQLARKNIKKAADAKNR